MSETLSHRLTQKLEQRGYSGQMALGYLDAISDLLKIEDSESSKQPHLNPNQQRVLNGLQFICNNYSREHQITNGIKYTLRDFYWYLATDYSVLENEMIEHMCKSHELLTADEFSQVLQVFSRWTQEQRDNNETSQTGTFI